MTTKPTPVARQPRGSQAACRTSAAPTEQHARQRGPVDRFGPKPSPAARRPAHALVSVTAPRRRNSSVVDRRGVDVASAGVLVALRAAHAGRRRPSDARCHRGHPAQPLALLLLLLLPLVSASRAARPPGCLLLLLLLLSLPLLPASLSTRLETPPPNSTKLGLRIALDPSTSVAVEAATRASAGQ